jgi:DNA-binding response OmpR family regulator
MILKALGFETCTACDGRQALEVFQRDHPDLLITDLNMPHMNGFDLIRNIRAISTIPIVLMTGGQDSIGNYRASAFDAGADSFISKPFDLVDIEAQINLLLEKAQLHKELPEIKK